MHSGKKILIISGGLLHERDISLKSGRRLATALYQEGFQTKIADIDGNLFRVIKEYQPDLIWPMVHGEEGESGSLQDLLELLALPYLGTNPKGARISWSKAVSKAIVDKNGLPTPAFVTLPQLLFRQVGVEMILELIENQFPYPLIVKPARGGSAMGISTANNQLELRNAMVNAFAYDDEIIIEKYIKGREISVSMFSIDGKLEALPIVEVYPETGKYDYEARYSVGTTEFFVPAKLDSGVTEKIKELAIRCHQVLELGDLSRIDFMIDDDNNAWFIDANVVPGMTDTSLWPLAAEAGGGFNKLVANLAAHRISE